MRVTFLVLLISLTATSLQAQKDSVYQVAILKRLSMEELMNIEVVTASKSGQPIHEAPSTMRVITAEQIQERGYEELDDAIRDIVGVDAVHASGGFPVIRAFRGMYGDENRRMLFMIDGVVENNLIGSAEMGGPVYSLHNVERIEIIWGPGSALYGANAYSGVINIITKKGGDINGVNYQRGYGSFNTSFEKAMFGAKKSGFDIAFSGAVFNTDGPNYKNRDPNFSNAYVNKAFSFNANVAFSSRNVKTTFGYRAFKTPMGFGTFLNSPTNLLGLPPQGNGNTGNFGILSASIGGERPSVWIPNNSTAFIQNEIAVSPKFSIFSRVQYRETGLSDASYFYITFDGKLVNKNKRTHYSNRVAADISSVYNFSKNQKLSVGVLYSQDNLELGYRAVVPDTRVDTIEHIPVTNLRATFRGRVFSIQHNLGTYIQYVLNSTFLNKTNFTIGGRYDDNSVYGTTINPRIGIVNQPVEKITIKLLYGSAFRAPTNFELYNSSPIRIPNLDLKPEKIKTFELNFIYTLSKFCVLQTNLFSNDLKDIIVVDVPIENNKVQNQNSGTAVVNGLETTLDILPSGSFSGFINFTYQKGRQNNGFESFDIPNIAKYKGNAGLAVHFDDLFSISLISNWVGKRSVAQTNPLEKVKGYFITNFVISTKPLFENRVRASVNIRNLFNHEYLDPGIRSANGNLEATALEQPGINALFKISVSLN